MRKKLFVVVLIACMCFGLSSCVSYENAREKESDFGGEYFVSLKKWEDYHGIFRIVYAKDTKVMYIVWESGYKASITPLYNTDGTLQIYEENGGEEWKLK